MAVAVGQVDGVDLELFLLVVEVDPDDEVALDELARDVGAGRPHLRAEVEDEPGELGGNSILFFGTKNAPKIGMKIGTRPLFERIYV